MGKSPTPIGRTLPLWSGWLVLILSVCILLLATIAWRASRSLDTLTLRSDWVTHTERVRYEISGILQAITDIETGERGFAISGNAAFLRPYQDAREALDSDLTALRQLTS